MAGKRFPAKYDGKCKSCWDPIYQGETVAFSSQEPGKVLCADCAEKEDEESL